MRCLKYKLTCTNISATPLLLFQCSTYASTPSFASAALAIYYHIPHSLSTNLYQNVFNNPNPRSNLKYIEVTNDKLRLEFDTPRSEEYRAFAKLITSPEDVHITNNLQIPDCFVPEEALNREYCGAGATIILNRKKVQDFVSRVALSDQEMYSDDII